MTASLGALALMAVINLNPLLNPHYQDFHQCTDEEVLVYGGANAGKSYSIADKLLLQAVWQKRVPRIKILCLRKTLPSLRRSVVDILERRAKALGFGWNINKNDWHAQVRNLTFVFCSLHTTEDYEKLKSMTDIDLIWINELLEIRERDYEEILRRLRGGQSSFQQVISDFNPEDEFSWVHDRFFVQNIGNARRFHRTIEDNHPDYLKTDRAKREIARLKRTKQYDPNLYRIYFEGKWGRLEGRIFEWDIGPLPECSFDEIFYGGDFGYSVDPAALVKIYRRADEIWVQELIYENELTNIQLGRRMIAMGFQRDDRTVWDSAEPKSIQELVDLGITALPAVKGPDSVRAGIDLAKSLKIHIVEGSDNLAREVKKYVWAKDKDGKSLNVPVENDDHAIKATIYALRTLYGKPQDDSIYEKALL